MIDREEGYVHLEMDFMNNLVEEEYELVICHFFIHVRTMCFVVFHGGPGTVQEMRVMLELGARMQNTMVALGALKVAVVTADDASERLMY